MHHFILSLLLIGMPEPNAAQDQDQIVLKLQELTCETELDELKNVVGVTIRRNPVESLRLAHQLSTLRILRLRNVDIDDAVLTSILEFDELEEIDVGGSNLVDSDLQSIASLRNLRSIKLWMCPATGKGLSAFRSHKLNEIELIFMHSADGLRSIVNLPNMPSSLETLRIHSFGITDQDTVGIEKLTNLKVLDFSRAKVTEALKRRWIDCRA